MLDTGKLEVYRPAGGFGIRLDESSTYAGAEVTPFYDSLLLKVRGGKISNSTFV